MFDDKYSIKADSQGYYISAGFTSGTSWQNPYSGTPPPNYYVYREGTLHDFALAYPAYAEVYVGGKANTVTVQNGGKLYANGGTVIGGVVQAGGSVSFAGDATFTNLTISNGGEFNVGYLSKFATCALTGTNVLKAGVFIGRLYATNGKNDATFTGRHTLSAGMLTVSKGALTSNLSILNFGDLTVATGGKAENTMVTPGGNLTVLSTGQAENTHVSGTLLVSNGGTVTETRVSSGGLVTVKGTAKNTVVFANGQEIVEGGVASKTIVSAGGLQRVESGGKIDGTKLQGSAKVGGSTLSGGVLEVYSGTATNVHINGGAMYLKAASVFKQKASAYDTILAKGVMHVSEDSYAYNTTISKGALQYAGGIDSKATIAGTQKVHGGSAYNATVKAGGKQILVYDTALAKGTTVEKDGILSSYVFATTSNTLIRGKAVIYSSAHDDKAKIYGTQVVKGGAVATDARIYDGGKQSVSTGGTASGTVISRGGTQSIVSAYAYNTKVGKGGVQIVAEGVASGTIISDGGSVDARAGGFVAGVQVKNGGVLTVRQSGALTWGKATVSSGGKVVLKEGASFDELDARKGAIISGGAVKKKITASSELAMNGNVNAKDLHVATTKIGMLKIHVAGVKNTLGSLKDNVGADYLQVSEAYRTRLSYDLRSAQTGTNMLTLSNASKLRCYCTIQAAKNQKTGTYKLSKGLNLTFGKMATDPNGITIKVGTTRISVKTTDISAQTGTTVKKNGMSYTLSLIKNQFNLSIDLVNGAMRKGTAQKDELIGTANSDIFYGGKGNDTITGKNGRDVAVYDKTSWGKDTIAKTNGTMTLLFKDLKSNDIVKKLSGTTMTITRKGDKNQKITINGWSNSTHNVVFGSGMTKFTNYLKAASPTDTQHNSARNEVWKKAGLASA